MLPLLGCPSLSACCPSAVLTWYMPHLSCQVGNLLTEPTLQKGAKPLTNFVLPHPSPSFSFSVPTWLFFIHNVTLKSWNEHSCAEAALAALSQVRNQSVSAPQLGLLNYLWFTKPLQRARWSFGTCSLLQLLHYIKGISNISSSLSTHFPYKQLL